MTLDHDHDPVVVFFNREIGLAKIYLYTKFEGFSFARSKFMEGSQNLKNGHRDPYHAIGVFFNRKMGLVKI